MTLFDTGPSADVYALFVMKNGPYPSRVVDCWDEERDAYTFNPLTPKPIVAHPACGPWGTMRHLCTKQNPNDAPWALQLVRQYGGVLEHPAGSLLWREYQLPAPARTLEDLVRRGEKREPVPTDEHNGFTLEVDQCAWGHACRKRTWLYCVGVDFNYAWGSIRVGGTPTHQIATHRNETKTLPDASRSIRKRTPPAFADWLISLARTVKRWR